MTPLDWWHTILSFNGSSLEGSFEAPRREPPNKPLPLTRIRPLRARILAADWHNRRAETDLDRVSGWTRHSGRAGEAGATDQAAAKRC